VDVAHGPVMGEHSIFELRFDFTESTLNTSAIHNERPMIPFLGWIFLPPDETVPIPER
jgi:hypothetical protein